ncbi:MAG: SAM-dependent chlorinase/fluorinase [Candidatus Latescibacteria bacterium]|nr:SAM-dependent chlorinase/fluorinase [Candidatus Latescibacterota bacterium]
MDEEQKSVRGAKEHFFTTRCSSIVTLTTDFGTRDPFVGAMKGVMLGIHPDVRIVDIAHEIPPRDIVEAAFVLRESCPYFPAGTIHVAVVDPGVGSERRALIVETERYWFVGPDNGLFGWLDETGTVRRVVAITNRDLMRPEVSATFHGRDVFAPAAAHLSKGIKVSAFGPKVSDWVRLEFPQPKIEGDRLLGRVVRVDRFGNAITNISEETFWAFAGDGAFEIGAGAVRLREIARSYASVSEGEPLALFGSSGVLEVSVHGGPASETLGLAKDDTVWVVRKSSPWKSTEIHRSSP